MYKDGYLRIRQAFANYKVNGSYPIHYYNFWTDQLAKDIWFSRFIEHHGLLQNYRGKINFYSVLGPLNNLKELHKGVNIFFSGENMYTERFADYRSLCEHTNFDLYIDFDTSMNRNSIRFPLWLLYTFSPDSNYNDIKRKVDQLRFPLRDDRTGFCSLVASHDWNGIRGKIINELSEIDAISSGGAFRKNTDELNVLYENKKYDFIRHYKFNICPENSNALGYVTEKVFQAIEAGCIPIYWGSDNKPEEDILNQRAIICWNENGNNGLVVDFIRTLHSDSKLFQHFIEQPRLLSEAEDKIWEYYIDLKKKIIDFF